MYINILKKIIEFNSKLNTINMQPDDQQQNVLDTSNISAQISSSVSIPKNSINLSENIVDGENNEGSKK